MKIEKVSEALWRAVVGCWELEVSGPLSLWEEEGETVQSWGWCLYLRLPAKRERVLADSSERMDLDLRSFGQAVSSGERRLGELRADVSAVDDVEEVWMAVEVSDGRFAAWLASLPKGGVGEPKEFLQSNNHPTAYSATAHKREGDKIHIQHTRGTTTVHMSDTVMLPALRIRRRDDEA